MALVANGISAADLCDAAPVVTVSVSSNEPEDGTGDGNTTPDWEVVDNGDGTFDVRLRAERAGGGSGWVYTIEVTATDASGNGSSPSGEVSVARDKGASKGTRK